MELDGVLPSKVSCIPFYKLGLKKNLLALEFSKKNFFSARHGFKHEMVNLVSRPSFYGTASIMACLIQCHVFHLTAWPPSCRASSHADFIVIFQFAQMRARLASSRISSPAALFQLPKSIVGTSMTWHIPHRTSPWLIWSSFLD